MPTAFPSVVSDPARLDALTGYAILDTPAEPGFDGIVHLARRLCRTPVALVSLVAEDRQWFKANAGFPHAQTDLDRSVCAHALAQPDELLIIPDLVLDPRTAGNPLVTGEPFIRFYAGAPLRAPEGHVLGSLCVIDTLPRPSGLTPEQADDLRTLAHQVVTQMGMRRAVEDRDKLLASQQTELRQARRLNVLAKATAALLVTDEPTAVLEPILAEGADALGFDRAYLYDVAPDGRHLRLTHAVNATPETRDAFARMPFGAPLCGIVADTRRPLVLTDVQAGTEPELAAPRALGLDAYAGFPVISRGELCAVLAFASTREPAFDAEALSFFETLARLSAAVYERLDGEAELAEVGAYWRSLFERLSEGFIVGEVVRDPAGRAVDWRYVEVNRAWGDLVGVDARAAIGRTVREVLPGIEDEWVSGFTRVVETGQGADFTRRIGVTHRWYEGRAFPLHGDRFGVIFLEITRRVAAEERRTALLALGDQLRDLATVPEMTRAASEIVGRTLGVSRAGFGRIIGDVEYVDIEPDWTAPGQGSVAGRHRYDDFGNIRTPLQRGEPLVVDDVTDDLRTRADAGTWQSFDVNAFVHMPVRERGRTVAVFIVHDVKPRAWSAEELGFLRNVADRVEVGVARVRAEELQGVLNHELAHRLKNTLAIVQSIATQTLRGVTEREPVEAFERRVLALARAHDVLMHRSWTAARMRAVMESVLAMQADLDRFAFDGQDMDISPQAALSLSLLLHELATNALKYGALSAEAGKVRIAWRTDQGQAPTLVLDWTESGGPAVSAPSGRGGFGSKLIRMGLLGTRVADLRYDPVGLQAEFRAPLAEIQVQVH